MRQRYIIFSAIIGLLLILGVNLMMAQETALPDKIELLIQNGSLNQASVLIESILADQPKNVPVLLLKARLLQTLHQNDAAKDVLKKVIVLDPGRKEAYNQLGYLEYLDIKGKKTPKMSLKNLWIDMFKQRRAIKYLKEALQIDSNYVDAKRNLALVYQNSLNEKNLKKAAELMKSIEPNSVNSVADLTTLGRLQMDLNRLTLAESTFTQLLLKNPFSDVGNYYASRLYFRTNRFEEGTEHFYRALNHLSNLDLLSDLYWNFKIVAGPAERKAYEQATSKNAYLLKFWRSRDPSPTTDVNEFLGSVYQRIDKAKYEFKSADYRGYDDRGLIYVRYGPPDERLRDPSVDPNIYWDSETWVYHNIAPSDVVFNFIRAGDTYRLVDNLRDILRTGHQNALGLLYLLEKRTHISPVFAKYYSEFQLIANGDITNSLRNTNTMDSRTFSLETDMEESMARIREKAPHSAYRDPNKPIPVIISSADFRAGDQVQHEIYLGIPYSELKFQEAGENLHARLNIALEVQDENFETLKRFDMNRHIRVKPGKDLSRMYFLDKLVCQLSPGKYNIGIAVKNRPSGGQYSRRIGVLVRPFPQKNLALSDIEFSPVIKSRKRIRTTTKVLKDNFIIIPYPFLEIRKERPQYIYFEIYNLKLNSEGESHYTVDYKVETLQSKKKKLGGFLSHLNPFGGGGKRSLAVNNSRTEKHSSVPEYVALDMSHLKDGQYMLTVRVKDENNPGAEAVSQKPFILRK